MTDINPLTGGGGNDVPATLPATGAWLETHPAGPRRFADLGHLDLEAGGTLEVRLAYETWGEYRGDNAILLCHPLTGDSHATGGGGWWEDIVGPGKAIDTDRFYVVSPNCLGGCQGSTGPASLAPDGVRYGSRFPTITVRDQVGAEKLLQDHLGVARWELVAGASAGGHRVMEWAASYPEDTAAIAVLVSNGRSTAEQIAWAHQQINVIKLDPWFRGGDYYEAGDGMGPHRGLGLARAIAHTTYRSPAEYDQRFGNSAQAGEDPLAGGRFAIGSYLDYHGGKLAARFDANSYIALTETMMTHDIGRGRGGLDKVLAGLGMPALVVRVTSDRLFYPEDMTKLAQALPGCTGVRTVESLYGHDGFLVESEQVSRIMADFIATLTGGSVQQ